LANAAKTAKQTNGEKKPYLPCNQYRMHSVYGNAIQFPIHCHAIFKYVSDFKCAFDVCVGAPEFPIFPAFPIYLVLFPSPPVGVAAYANGILRLHH